MHALNARAQACHDRNHYAQRKTYPRRGEVRSVRERSVRVCSLGEAAELLNISVHRHQLPPARFAKGFERINVSVGAHAHEILRPKHSARNLPSSTAFVSTTSETQRRMRLP